MSANLYRTVLIVALFALAAWASAEPAATGSDAEAAYTASIEKRASNHIAPLKLDDAKSASVRKTIVDQYRALRDWHAANDATVKDLKKQFGSEQDVARKAHLQAQLDKAEAGLRELHNNFLADLGKDLTPEQIDVVKDEMTYNVRNVTYKAFNEMLPDLKDNEKAEIMKQLTEARELAMDQGSSDEKHAVFGKYKGKINVYLGKQGYDLKAASKAFNEKINAQKNAKKNNATTQPAAEAGAQ
jgi:hypothetical protein